MHGPSAPSEEQQALATFNHAAEEIRFFKGQQWHVTNYALAAYAALVVAPSLVEQDSWRFWISVFALVLVWVAAVAAWRVLVSLERSLEKEGDRLPAARARLPLIKQIHEEEYPREDRSTRRWWSRVWKPLVMPVLVAVVFLGAVVASLIIVPSLLDMAGCTSAALA